MDQKNITHPKCLLGFPSKGSEAKTQHKTPEHLRLKLTSFSVFRAQRRAAQK